MANGQRQYESATIFGARIVTMNHLWTPTDVYKGKKQEKPSYFAGFIVPKTQAQWAQEPILAGLCGAFGRIFQNHQHVVTWPIMDGDLPNPETGKHSEWARNHWLFSASSGNAPNIELVQAGGQLVKLQNKVGVKSGDYVMVGVTAVVKQNDARAVKLYLNAVVFSAPGEEIAVGNSVTGAELMQQAQRQGLQVAGFAPNAGFGGNGGGFNPGGGGNFNPGAVQNGGNPGFTQGGVPGAPTNPNGFAPQATAPSGAGFGGNAASPSNGAPAFNPGGAPQNPFAHR